MPYSPLPTPPHSPKKEKGGANGRKGMGRGRKVEIMEGG